MVWIGLIYATFFTFTTAFSMNVTRMRRSNKDGDNPCPEGWLYFRSKCYRLGGVDNQKTWEEAAGICTAYGGHLVSIHSKEELDFLTTHMIVNIKTSVWLGMNDREKESEFKWHDGSPVDYTNWLRYEPTGDTYGNEDCVAMIFSHFSRQDDVSGQWNDESCDSKHPYICQIKKKDSCISKCGESSGVKCIGNRFAGTPVECKCNNDNLVFDEKTKECRVVTKDGDTPCEEGWLHFRSKCYRLGGIHDKKTWEKAADICTTYGGHLVSIHSKEELDFLTTHMIVNIKTSVWLGLNDREKESEFKWHDGSPVDYTNWLRYEPTGGTYGNEDCVAMIFSHFSRQDDVSGQWNDESCGSEHPYICQIQHDAINYCPNPGAIANGRVVLIESIDERRVRPPDPVDDLDEEFPEGSQLRYSCYSGYAIRGGATITCKTSGQWSAKRPRCMSVRDSYTMHCRNPGSILNGRVDVIPPGANTRSRLSEEKLEYPEGTQLEYTCDDGYFQQGSDSLRCLSTGFWSTDITLQNCAAVCGRSFAQTTEKIAGGDKSGNGEWPWVVAIAIVENNYPSVICGGVLINSQTVLTAAHCLDSSKTYNLYFGTTNPRKEYESVRRSTAMISHPDYNENSMDSDIGLIKFAPKIQFTRRVQPICLPTGESTATNLVTGKMGHVAGWGYTELDRQPNDLLHASLPYLSNRKCIESYKKKSITLDLTTNMFCAGHDNHSQATCEGDSGSGLVFKNRLTQRYTVEGVVSFGVQNTCGLSGYFQVFTKVVRFLDWIHRNF